MRFVVAAAQRTMAGQRVCGDGYRVFQERGPMVALADGLGHGPAASEAAEAFCSYVAGHLGETIEQLLRGAGQAISQTRGVAAGILVFDAGKATVAFGGIGNIELVAAGASRARPVSIPGILGKPLRKVVVFEYPVAPGDLFAMFTDGVSSRLDIEPLKHLGEAAMCSAILERYGKQHDDATCVVARVCERAAPGPTQVRASDLREEVCGPMRVGRDFDAVWISARVSEAAKLRGLNAKSAWQVAIAVSELVRNAARHAGGGTVRVRWVDEPRRGVEVVVDDDGPGIPDPSQAEVDGYSEGRLSTPDDAGRPGRSLGAGLGAVRRMMDIVRFENKPTGGLRVTALKWLG